MGTIPHPHPLDPIMGNEIRLAVNILKASYAEVPLKYKRIDIQEPAKREAVPCVEAQRLGRPLPKKPAEKTPGALRTRLLYHFRHIQAWSGYHSFNEL